MKKTLTILLLFLFAFPAFAQRDSLVQFMIDMSIRTDATAIFGTKFYKVETWDAKRSKPIPGEFEIWTLSGLQPAMDISTRKPIDWGANGDRFVALGIVQDLKNRPYNVKDNILKTSNCLTFTLNLYEIDGKFVKNISKWGYLIGDGVQGVVYVQEGVYATFLSNVKVEKGGSITYQAQYGVINKLDNLAYEDEMIPFYRYGGKGSRANNIPLQLSGVYPPKPIFDTKKTEILNKIIAESPFLQAKFYQEMVYDAGRKDWPEPNKVWNFWNIVIPLDIVNLCMLDWGPNGDRYVQFDIEFEGKRNYSALIDDMYNTGLRFIFPLRLYEKDGRFVKTVSNFGNFFGFGEGSFVYIQEVKNTNTTFFTKLPVKYGQPFSYKVQRDRVTKISQLLKFQPAQ